MANSTLLSLSCRAKVVPSGVFLWCRWCSTSFSCVESNTPQFSNAKKYRYYKNELLRQNRRNPELEEKARLKKLYIPLEEVRSVWLAPRGQGFRQLQTSGLHSNIYNDVFGAVFRPLGFLEVLYSNCHVTWGDVIPAKDALVQPKVILPHQLKGDYASLILTNPDGHLHDNTQELLHWMVINIPLTEGCGETTQGHHLVPYLPPVPPKGTGFHRYVFSLYTHPDPLPQDPAHVGVAMQGWLQQRLFSSARFLSSHDVKPWTFSYFQSQWDSSVQHTYKHVLKYPEPMYGPERILGPRKQRKKLVYLARQSRYTHL